MAINLLRLPHRAKAAAVAINPEAKKMWWEIDASGGSWGRRRQD